MMKDMTRLLILAGILWTQIVGQTGGGYDLSHNVIASGGGSRSNGGPYSLDGTSGQGVAGTISTGNTYSLRAGFWAFQSLAPTAAGTTVSGCVRTSDGRGIRNVTVKLTNPATGAEVTALTSSFGFYVFESVEVGHVYMLSVSSKQYSFEPAFRIISVVDVVIDEDFVALPE